MALSEILALIIIVLFTFVCFILIPCIKMRDSKTASYFDRGSQSPPLPTLTFNSSSENYKPQVSPIEHEDPSIDYTVYSEDALRRLGFEKKCGWYIRETKENGESIIDLISPYCVI